MYTIIETPTFQKQSKKIWSDDERMDFISWISMNPLVGDVIPHADGARKVRWSVKGSGKRGGVRVIYFNKVEQGQIILIAAYKKSEQENISPDKIDEAK